MIILRINWFLLDKLKSKDHFSAYILFLMCLKKETVNENCKTWKKKETIRDQNVINKNNL